MKQEKAYKSMIGEKKMKDILKGVTVKILSVIVMIALIVGGGCFAYKYYIGKITNKTEHEVVNSIEVVKEKLETAAELNTGSYLCTDCSCNYVALRRSII